MKRILAILMAAVIVFFGFTGCEAILEALGLASETGVILKVEIDITNADSVRVSITNDGDTRAINVEFKLYLTTRTDVQPSEPLIFNDLVDVPPQTTLPVDVAFTDFDVPDTVAVGDYKVGVIIETSGTTVKATSADMYTYDGGAALTAPATPTGLMVTATTTTSISLSWNASTGATGYEVYRDNGAGGPITNKVFDNTGTTMSDSGLDPGTTYYYKVLAKNSAGSSTLSAAVPGTTQTATGVPATPAIPWVTGTTTSTISLAWSPVTGATGYILQWGPTVTGPFDYAVYTGPLTYADDTGLTAGSVNYYRVIATNTSGSSGSSPVLTATADTGVSGDIWEPDNDYSYASTLALNVEQVHSIDPIGDEDWYAISVVNGNAYIVETYSSGGVDTDTVLYVYANDATSIIGSNDDGGGTPAYSLFEFTATATTTYYVKIYEFGYNAVGDYAIIFTQVAAPVLIDISIQ